MKRFQGLSQVRFFRVNGYRTPDDEAFSAEGGAGQSSVRYDCIEDGQPAPDETHVWAISDYTGSSDYSGGSVARANMRAFLELIEEHEDADANFYQAFYGGYGTQDIAFHVKKSPDYILEALESLETYPVLNEDILSELEMEEEFEAWESWAADDFRRALAERFGCDPDELTGDNDQLFTAFHEASQSVGWSTEHNTDGPRFNFSEEVLSQVAIKSVLPTVQSA